LFLNVETGGLGLSRNANQCGGGKQAEAKGVFGNGHEGGLLVMKRIGKAQKT
jgi:hypothetical protein